MNTEHERPAHWNRTWTKASALRELTQRPLTFGDENQIRAHKFLEQLELARESYENCRERHSDVITECTHCDGDGEGRLIRDVDCFECDGSGCEECEDGEVYGECRDCDGTGKTVFFDESCACIAIYKPEVIEALRGIVKNVRAR